MDFLLAIESWHWLSLGMLVLIGEALGAGGFLLGMGIASLIIAVVLAIFPNLAWHWQFLLFAFLSVVVTLVYWKKFRRFNNKTEQPLLNSGTARYIGRRVSLLTPVRDGRGKVQIEDALWTVSCSEDLEQGAIVDVVAADGMTLIVEPHKNPSTITG
jgi:membrane protein implicated in regulation of membrane protease activity